MLTKILGIRIIRTYVMRMKIVTSNIVTAFEGKTVGTRVLYPEAFMEAIYEALRRNPAIQKEGGMLQLEGSHIPELVTSGVARREGLSVHTDFVVREHRGEVCLFAKREKATKCENVGVIIYTLQGYLDDPEVSKEEAQRVTNSQATHILVAVLASAGPKPPLTSHRFVRNLAGGNNYHRGEDYCIEDAREEAAEITSWEQDWIVVADVEEVHER
jgi:hypothetical protein